MEDATPDHPLDPALSKFVENIALYYEGYGIPRIGGRMFGLLLVAGTPLSAEQIAEVLQASRSSVSTNVRALIANGWVEKVTFPGNRTDYFQFSSTAWDSVMERRRQAFAPLQVIVTQAQKALPPDSPAHIQLADMMAWTDLMMHHYEALLAAWQARRDEQKET